MTWTACHCKYICDIYLSNLDFNGLGSETFIYKIAEDIQYL